MIKCAGAIFKFDYRNNEGQLSEAFIVVDRFDGERALELFREAFPGKQVYQIVTINNGCFDPIILHKDTITK